MPWFTRPTSGQVPTTKSVTIVTLIFETDIVPQHQGSFIHRTRTSIIFRGQAAVGNSN
jgi:hypothetical protein